MVSLVTPTSEAVNAPLAVAGAVAAAAGFGAVVVAGAPPLGAVVAAGAPPLGAAAFEQATRAMLIRATMTIRTTLNLTIVNSSPAYTGLGVIALSAVVSARSSPGRGSNSRR